MTTNSLATLVAEAFHRRRAPIERLSGSADDIAAACFDMARRFHRGGRLLVFGNGNAATDAQHVSVEFVHPVIVGKRGLPAFSLVADTATVTGLARAHGADAVFEHQVAVLGKPVDIALGVSADGDCVNVQRALRRARADGLLTVALVGGDGGAIARDGLADHCLLVASNDPRVVKEGHVTLYHVLWELVHVFFEQPGVFAEPDLSARPAVGIAGLYPFLYAGASDLPGILEAVARSTREKVAEIVRLRESVGEAEGERLAACAAELAEAFAGGGALFAFGNGGSSTDAQDIVHTFLDPEGSRSTADATAGTSVVDSTAAVSNGTATPTTTDAAWTALPALCLTSDAAVVTALSNDVSFDVVFARQLRAVGGPGDIAVAVSTSGGSANVLAGLAEAKAIGMVTVGMAGYGGGKMAESGDIDRLFAVPSSSVHRVQEVQTTIYHVLWETVQAALNK